MDVLTQNLFWAAVMVMLTTIVHFMGITGLIAFLRSQRFQKGSEAPLWRQAGAILMVVFCLFGLHTVEVWMYAQFYLLVGAFETVEEALYFSTSTFTTVGFGDLYLDESWRLFSAVESANGFLLIGWSTAFLVSVTARMRMFEAELEEEQDPQHR